MLSYLNGNDNVAGNPNENYARELMELFTMGEGNGYSQQDIVEMSRALTGWRANEYQCTPPYFDPTKHDNSPKTIFGQTANFTYTTAHNLIFSARATQVSHYITGKLYRHFVASRLDNEVITGLAQTFRNSNWELMPVIKQLVKSEHFFEEAFIGARLKNPLESMLGILKSAGVTAPQVADNWWNALFYWSNLLGQEILNPPNVAGWKEHHAWLNESTLTARWNYSSSFAYFLTTDEAIRENLRSLALSLSSDSNDPDVIVRALTLF